MPNSVSASAAWGRVHQQHPTDSTHPPPALYQLSWGHEWEGGTAPCKSHHQPYQSQLHQHGQDTASASRDKRPSWSCGKGRLQLGEAGIYLDPLGYPQPGSALAASWHRMPKQTPFGSVRSLCSEAEGWLEWPEKGHRAEILPPQTRRWGPGPGRAPGGAGSSPLEPSLWDRGSGKPGIASALRLDTGVWP